MNKTFVEELGMKGHLTIHKVVDGCEELIYDENNVIVSGFGWSLSHLYGLIGSNKITDYQIDRFQLGVSGNVTNQLASTFQLSGPLSSTDEYLSQSDSNLDSFTSDVYLNGSVATQVFAKIPYTKVTRIDNRSVRYTIFVDEDSCNDLTRNGNDAPLNEIGLFLKNPRGKTNDESVLAAYRYFSNITKTSDFGLVFRWTISFA